MESSPASADVKGSTQAKRKRERQKTEERKRKTRASESDNNKRRRACRTGRRGPETTGLPAHAVATGSPVEPDCMEGWKDDCRSKRSLSIFTALKTRHDKMKKYNL